MLYRLRLFLGLELTLGQLARSACAERTRYLHGRRRWSIAEFALDSACPAALVFCGFHELLRFALELDSFVVSALLVQLLSFEHGLLGLAHLLLGLLVVLFGMLLELLALALA